MLSEENAFFPSRRGIILLDAVENTRIFPPLATRIHTIIDRPCQPRVSILLHFIERNKNNNNNNKRAAFVVLGHFQPLIEKIFLKKT